MVNYKVFNCLRLKVSFYDAIFVGTKMSEMINVLEGMSHFPVSGYFNLKIPGFQQKFLRTLAPLHRS